MRTSIGDYLKKLRISMDGMLLKDMAEDLGVTSSFLSAVECGKKKFPQEWFKKIQELYHLEMEDMREMKEAVAKTNKSVEINLDNLSTPQKQLAISFARNLDYIDKDTAKVLFDLLNKTK